MVPTAASPKISKGKPRAKKPGKPRASTVLRAFIREVLGVREKVFDTRTAAGGDAPTQEDRVRAFAGFVAEARDWTVTHEVVDTAARNAQQAEDDRNGGWGNSALPGARFAELNGMDVIGEVTARTTIESLDLDVIFTLYGDDTRTFRMRATHPAVHALRCCTSTWYAGVGMPFTFAKSPSSALQQFARAWSDIWHPYYEVRWHTTLIE